MSEHATFTASGELEVVRVDGVEGVCRHFQVVVTCRASAAEAPQPSALVGTSGTLELNDGAGGSRSVAGVIVTARTAHHDDGTVILECVVRPPAVLLLRGRNCRAFQDMTVVDIAAKVLAAVPHRFEVSGSFPVREYTVQYREDDWSFVARLLEEEGIYFWYDHAAGSMLVFSDTSAAAPDLAGGGEIPFHRETGMVPDREVIEALGGAARAAPSAFATKSFNPASPDLAVSGSAGSGALEIYDAPGGGPVDPAQAQRKAALMAGASAAAAAGASGKTNCVRVCPGRVLTVSGHPLASQDGAYFLTAVSYQVRQRRRGTGSDVDRAYTCYFSGIDKATPFVPPRSTPPALQAGIQTGVVGGAPGTEIHPTEAGEVRVQQHWDREGTRDDKSGTWMRVAQRGTNDSLQLPRVGWNVLTFNEEGASDAPSVLARINDGEHPPAYPLPANKTRVVFKTATSPADGTFNEIYFEDKQGSEEMFIHASRDMNLLVQQDQQQTVGHDLTQRVGVDHTLVALSERMEEVHNDQSISVGANDTLAVGANHQEATKGNLTINVGGNRRTEVGDSYSLQCSDLHDVGVGAARVDVSLGQIGASAKLVTMTTGAAQLKLAAQGITDTCGGVSVQTIGGAKLEFTKGARPTNVDKALVETVGGVMMLKTDEAYVDAATKKSTWVSGLMLKSKADKRILIEAKDKIEITCGGSSIVIEPKNIKISTTKLELSDADMVKIETKEILHNS